MPVLEMADRRRAVMAARIFRSAARSGTIDTVPPPIAHVPTGEMVPSAVRFLTRDHGRNSDIVPRSDRVESIKRAIVGIARCEKRLGVHDLFETWGDDSSDIYGALWDRNHYTPPAGVSVDFDVEEGEGGVFVEIEAKVGDDATIECIMSSQHEPASMGFVYSTPTSGILYSFVNDVWKLSPKHQQVRDTPTLRRILMDVAEFRRGFRWAQRVLGDRMTKLFDGQDVSTTDWRVSRDMAGLVRRVFPELVVSST